MSRILLTASVAGAISGATASAANQPPVAIAGDDVLVNDNGSGRECVQLYGNYSYDPDGRLAEYRWTEDGKEIAQSARYLDQFFPLGTHVLTLTVTDNEGASASDTVTITVRQGHDTSPYPDSGFITGVTFDWSTKRKAAPGSDNWPITWADDGHQYTSWGDGGGFGGSNGDGRVSLGFGRVEGDWDAYTGHNGWGGKDAEHPATFTGKACGLVSIGGVLYALRWRGPDEPDKSRLIRSDDRGATWTTASWAWDQHDDEVHAGTICNAGQNHRGAPDGYVYFYFTRIRLPEHVRYWHWIQLAENDVVLARAPSPDYSRRTSRATRSFEREPVSRTLPAENSVWVSVLAVKHTVPLMAQPRDQGCRSATASPLLWGARVAVHRE